MIAVSEHALVQEKPWRALYTPSALSVPPIPGSMLDIFRHAVEQNGDGPAILYFDGAVSYKALDALSDKLAHYWLTQGIKAGDRIAIILQNVPQAHLGVVAAWKIGAIPVTINPMYRTAELEKLFADSEPSAILCLDADHAVVTAAAGGRIAPALIVSTSPHAFQQRNDMRVLPPPIACPDGAPDLARILDDPAAGPVPHYVAHADDIALLLYTSGTTGVPKAAMLTHHNLAANSIRNLAWFEFDQNSVIFGIAPLFHITGFVCHLCVSFMAAAPVVLTYRFAPTVALDAFVEHRPTFVVGAITVFIALMQMPEATRDHFSSFTNIYSGGAPVAPAIVEKFALQFGKNIRNCYGMTESASAACASPREGPIPVDPTSGALAIGIPFPGTDAVIVDEDGELLPIGEAGELLIRGDQVMTGYWQKPEESAQALKDGWLHTGDVAFRDAQGWFYLVDRKKDMIVASGFKVWPREVEDVLYAHPAVREAAVIGEPDTYRGETVAAFISLAGDGQVVPEDIIAWCRERLAAYKCPRRVEILPELPKTVSGKIMRAELRTA